VRIGGGEKLTDTPESMKAELSKWNDGAGIDIESWVGCEGNFSLAVGYTSIFWPSFTLFEGYILREGFSEDALRGFEATAKSRKSVEWLMNHLHIASIQHGGCSDNSKDKLLLIGNVLKEIYQAKLHFLWPNRPCTVEFIVPANPDDLKGYQLSFWQNCHEEGV
jgi:hypothetical protein